MSLPILILMFLLLAGITVHTAGYALWNWRNGNKVGSVVVFIVSLAAIGMPVYMLFFRT